MEYPLAIEAVEKLFSGPARAFFIHTAPARSPEQPLTWVTGLHYGHGGVAMSWKETCVMDERVRFVAAKPAEVLLNAKWSGAAVVALWFR